MACTDLRRVVAHHVVGERGAARLGGMCIQTCELSHAGEHRRKQRLGAALRLRGRYSELLGKRYDAAGRREVVEAHRGILLVTISDVSPHRSSPSR